MSRRYNRLDALISAHAPPSDASPLTPEAEAAAARKREYTELVELVSAKVQALFWVALAALVWHYAQVRSVALDAERSNVIFMCAGAVASAVVFVTFLYLTVYLPYIARLRVDWDAYAPNAIPTATVAGLLAFFAFIVGLWPAYHLMTPLVVFALFMGAVMGTHFIPAF